MKDEVLYLGVKGRAAAFDKKTGRELWRTKLKGGSFVTLMVDENEIFAHTYGHLFCLDKRSGAIKWENNLPGLGYGLAMISMEGGQSSGPAEAQMIQAQQAAAAAAAASASAAAASSSS